MRLRLITAMMLTALLGSQAIAQTVLIDRSPDPNLLGSGIIGGIFDDRPGEEVSVLTEVTFTEAVTVGAITVFTTNLNGAFPDIGYPVGSSGPAVLNIFVGGTLDPLDDTLSGGPLGNPAAIVDYVATDDGIEITASGLEINLPATTFLIGITPILNFAANGQEFFLDAGASGETTFLNNPGGAFFLPVFGSATINANVLDLPTQFTGKAIRITAPDDGVLKGDVNGDGNIDLLDVGPFVDAISSPEFVPAADVNCDGAVNLLDIQPFVALITG